MVVALCLGLPLSAVARIADLSTEEQAALKAAVKASDLAAVTAAFDKHGLEAWEKIGGGSLYWLAVTAEIPADGSRLEILELFFERGGPVSGGGGLSDELYLRSIVPETSPEFLAVLESNRARGGEVHYMDSALARAATTRNVAVLQTILDRGESHPEGEASIRLIGSRKPKNARVDVPPPVVAAVSGRSFNHYTWGLAAMGVSGGDDPELATQLLMQWEMSAMPRGEEVRLEAQADVVATLELLDKETDIDWDAEDAYGMTALHYAALAGWPEVIEFLSEKKADPEVRDLWGRLPVHMFLLGTAKPDLQVIEGLAGEGAKLLGLEDGEGDTALASAFRLGRLELATMLISSGADPFSLDGKLESAASVAAPGSEQEKAVADGLKALGARMPFAYEAQAQKSVVSMPALLYMDSAGAAVGSSSATILTVSPRRSAYAAGPMNVRFNRRVGASMQGSLPKVSRYLAARVGGWPVGMEAEIRFENRYGGKDGDSASVVCGLLLYAAMTSYTIDETFCCTGSMDFDGKVQPIGGLSQKLSAVNKGGFKIMGIPPGNVDALRDHVLLNGIGDLASAQVFTMESFDDALALASTEKPEKLQAAMVAFAPVLRVLSEGKLEAVKHVSVQKRLREVLALAPNHISAQVLLEAGLGNLPKVLSLGGCFTALQDAYRPLNLALGNREFGRLKGMDENLYATSLSVITRLRPKLDPRARVLADAQADFAMLLKRLRERPPTSPGGIRKLIDELDTTYEKIESEYLTFAEVYNLEREELEDEEKPGVGEDEG